MLDASDKPSNNTAELEAMIEAIKWLADPNNVPKSAPVRVRPDSHYTQLVILGKSKPVTNRALAIKARDAWRNLRILKRGKAQCIHVRSHQVNIWNAEADKLANMGGAGLEGNNKSEEPPSKDIIPKIREIPYQTRAYEKTEAHRVLDAIHAFGTLELPLIKRLHPPGLVERRYEESLERIQREINPIEIKTMAIDKLTFAKNLLIYPLSQISEGSRLLADVNLTTPVIYKIHDCPIDTEALKCFACTKEAEVTPKNRNGNPNNSSYRDIIADYLKHVQIVPQGKTSRGKVSITYRHRGVGAELVAAGILAGARVYPDDSKSDPFTALPRVLRHIALGRYGYDFDDDSSHPRAAITLSNVGREESIRFLAHKEQIFEEVAKQIWPNDPPKEHRDKVKELFALKEMGGASQGWCNEHGISDRNKVLDIEVNIDGWQHLPTFSIRRFFEMLAARSEDIECRWTRTTDFVARWKAFYNPSDTDASATVQSFLRQEAEALSLKTKWHVLKCNSSCGAQPLNLQHDGLVARCGKIPPSKMRDLFEEYSSKVLRYHQPVKNKA